WKCRRRRARWDLGIGAMWHRAGYWRYRFTSCRVRGRVPGSGGGCRGEGDALGAEGTLGGGPRVAGERGGGVKGDAQLIRDQRVRVAESEEGGDRDGYRALPAQRFGAGGHGRARVDGVVDDAHPPAADAAGHRRQVIPGRLTRRAVAGQEGRREQVGDGVGQERAAFYRAADRVDRVLA